MNDIAASLGDPRVSNMVALGAFIKAIGIIPFKTVKRAMVNMLSHDDRLIEVNKQALMAGYNAV